MQKTRLVVLSLVRFPSVQHDRFGAGPMATARGLRLGGSRGRLRRLTDHGARWF